LKIKKTRGDLHIASARPSSSTKRRDETSLRKKTRIWKGTAGQNQQTKKKETFHTSKVGKMEKMQWGLKKKGGTARKPCRCEEGVKTSAFRNVKTWGDES